MRTRRRLAARATSASMGIALCAATMLAVPTLSSAATTTVPGTLDPSFSTGTGFTGQPSAPTTIGIQSDGKIVLGGFFSGYQGATATGVVRLNTDGSRDATFVGDTDGSVAAVVQQPDGMLILGGAFSKYRGQDHNDLVRVSPDGTVDPTFNTGTGFDDEVSSVVLAPNGDIYVAGFFGGYNGTTTGGLVRLNSDGSRDSSFNPGANNFGALTPIATMQLQSNGKLIVGGAFTSVDSVVVGNVARLTSTGGLDTSFNTGTGANSQLFGSAVQADGKFLLAGAFTQFAGQPYASLVRVSPDGALDTTFSPGGFGFDGQINAIAVEPNQQIVVAGNFPAYLGSPRGLARLNSNGALDTTFNPGGSGFDGGASFVGLQANGEILAGGFSFTYNEAPMSGVVRVFGGPVLTQSPLNNCVVLGKTKYLPKNGSRTLMKSSCTTNAGQRVGVRATGKLRGDVRAFTLFCQISPNKKTKTVSSNGSRICRKGKLRVRTHGKPITLHVSWSAPASGTYATYKQAKAFRTH